jgi:hypothetical protein
MPSWRKPKCLRPLDVETVSGRYLVNKQTRINADKKTELGDKPDFKLADYKEGQTVKLTIELKMENSWNCV